MVHHKFVVISHILPPSSSGQAVVLYHILKDVDPQKYRLVLTHITETNLPKVTSKLKAKSFIIDSARRLNIPYIPILTTVLRVYNQLNYFRYKTNQIYKIIIEENIQTVVTCTGNFSDIPAAFLASIRAKVSFVPYIFDEYIHQWTGLKRFIAKVISPYIFSHSWKIITTNELIAQDYNDLYKTKTIIVHNPSSITTIKKDSNLKVNGKELSIVYIGSIYHAHYDAFVNLIKAVGLINRINIKIHLYTNQPKSELETHGIKSPAIQFHPLVPNHTISNIFKQADILFLPLAFSSNIQEVLRTASPGKLGEYLCSGVPILAHAPKDSFLDWYFNKYRCGLIVNRPNVQLLAEAIEKLIIEHQLRNKLTENAYLRGEVDYSIEKNTEQFIKAVL